MSSESDSDASHVSSTPPRVPNPPKPERHNPKPKTRKHKRPNSDPDPITHTTPPSPSPDPPSLNGLPINRLLSRPYPLTSSSSSFASLLKSRKPDFSFSDFGQNDETAPASNAVKNPVSKSKKLKPNFIAPAISNLPPEILPKFKFSNEGNFVKLNINGYGRRTTYKSAGKNRCFSKKKRYFRKFQKGNSVVGEGENEDDGIWTESKEMDPEVQKAVEEVRDEASEENLRNLLKVVYGYECFREGQLEAIKKIIGGESMMLVLPTGAGKSLCYQLPALIFHGVTLVVSPLVALMVDQLRNLPPVIAGALLSSNQTIEEASETLNRLREGSIKVLYVSPERFLNEEFVSMFEDSLSVSLVVIDEAHCISEWSHNFRPSFFRLKASILRPKLNVQCFLAMTATATNQTLHDIMTALEIIPENLIHTCQIRENLKLSVTLQEHRLKDLLKLMKSPPFVDLRSIIIYCKFQAETDEISKYLCDNNIPAKGYHGGMFAKDRNKIQELFSSNKLRVIVGTVAFGMGLDKRDVEAVIHYSLPGSLEAYIQETGRAGRDGRLSHCHLFLDYKMYYKLRSLLYSDGVDEYAINKLLSHLFSNDAQPLGKICALIKESASQNFDMKEEVMLTILTQLELGTAQYICVLPEIKATCSVYFHKTTPELLSEKDNLVAVILELSVIKNGHYVFSIPAVANLAEITTTVLLRQLHNLKSQGEITYDLKDPAFCFMVTKKPDDICDLTTKLAKWLSEVEKCKVRKLDEIFNIANFAVKECKRVDGCVNTVHTPCIQRKVLNYFSRKNGDSFEGISCCLPKSSRFLHSDIKVFLQSNSHAKFTPRSIARIMHGIPSPAFTTSTWARCHFWGRYTEYDFPAVMEAAAAELMDFLKKRE